MRTLGRERRLLAGIVLGHQAGEPAPIGVEIAEIAAAAHDQALRDAVLQVPVRALDRAVLVAFAGIAARRGEPVVGAEAIVRGGDVRLRLRIEVAIGRRQAVRAQLARQATQRGERLAQALGQRREALAPEHDRRERPPRARQPRVQQPVRQRHATDRDVQPIHHREIGDQHRPGRMRLGEADQALGAGERAPLAHAPLERP